MDSDGRLVSEQFPRASQYHPDWVIANASGGANALWLTEWLTSALELRPGMRVLDLGCGRASSSIFLRREFEVQVWARLLLLFRHRRFVPELSVALCEARRIDR